MPETIALHEFHSLMNKAYYTKKGERVFRHDFRTYAQWPYLGRKEAEEFHGKFKDKKGELTVLNIGIGDGGQMKNFVKRLKELDSEKGTGLTKRLKVVMGDFSTKLLDNAKKNQFLQDAFEGVDVEYKHVNALDMPFDNEVDQIILNELMDDLGGITVTKKNKKFFVKQLKLKQKLPDTTFFKDNQKLRAARERVEDLKLAAGEKEFAALAIFKHTKERGAKDAFDELKAKREKMIPTDVAKAVVNKDWESIMQLDPESFKNVRALFDDDEQELPPKEVARYGLAEELFPEGKDVSVPVSSFDFLEGAYRALKPGGRLTSNDYGYLEPSHVQPTKKGEEWTVEGQPTMNVITRFIQDHGKKVGLNVVKVEKQSQFLGNDVLEISPSRLMESMLGFAGESKPGRAFAMFFGIKHRGKRMAEKGEVFAPADTKWQLYPGRMVHMDEIKAIRDMLVPPDAKAWDKRIESLKKESDESKSRTEDHNFYRITLEKPSTT
ncbi:class I SAM-dependent methyltransferase [archaeon]